MKFQRLHLGYAAGALVTTLIGGVLWYFPIGDELQRFSYDVPFLFTTKGAVDEVRVIYMDEASHSNLNQRFDTLWDRKLHHQLVEKLTADGAKMILFDILFSDSTTNDLLFAQAMSRHGKVFLGRLREMGFDGQERISDPTETLTMAAAGAGLIMFEPDDACYGVRKVPLGMPLFPSAAWVAASQFPESFIIRENVPFERVKWLRYYGPTGTLPGISYHKVISGELPSPGYFKDKFVFVGSRLGIRFIGSHKDEFSNPWSRVNREERPSPFSKPKPRKPLTMEEVLARLPSPGVDIHATAFLNLYRGEWLTRLNPRAEGFLICFVGLAAGFGLALLRPLQAIIAAAGISVLIFVTGLWLSTAAMHWFNWAVMSLVQVPLALGWSIVFTAIRAEISKAVLVSSIGKYVSPSRVKQVLKQPELIKPGGVKQEVSVLFSDIAGFSKVAQRLDPDDLIKLLNNYYETAIESVYQEEGTVMDLIGDAIFAMWNAPEAQQDHRERACRAALKLEAMLLHMDEKIGGPPLRTRVGLHTGIVCVGNVGSSRRFDFTAIGNGVNLASRLEGLNKQLGTEILATREIQKAVEHSLTSRLVGYFKFKGFEQVVQVYQLLGEKASFEAQSKPSHEAFAKGIEEYQRANFAGAIQSFRRTLELNSKDGPAQFYLERVLKFQAEPPPGEWDYAINLDQK